MHANQVYNVVEQIQFRRGKSKHRQRGEASLEMFEWRHLHDLLYVQLGV
ncbi:MULTISPECIES: hypothetical protein [unclassified Nostoc]|nr:MULTISPECIES: hypothetical protein [unclassified Nostoc]